LGGDGNTPLPHENNGGNG